MLMISRITKAINTVQMVIDKRGVLIVLFFAFSISLNAQICFVPAIDEPDDTLIDVMNFVINSVERNELNINTFLILPDIDGRFGRVFHIETAFSLRDDWTIISTDLYSDKFFGYVDYKSFVFIFGWPNDSKNGFNFCSNLNDVHPLIYSAWFEPRNRVQKGDYVLFGSLSYNEENQLTYIFGGVFWEW
jgi:hypothetical protein